MNRIAIIGKGIAGLTLAFRARQKGIPVDIIAPDFRPADASGVAQGIVCNKGLLVGEDDLFQAKLLGQKQLIRFIAEVENATGSVIPRLFNDHPGAPYYFGVREPYFSREEHQKIAARVFRQRMRGCFHVAHLPAGDSAGWGVFQAKDHPLGTFFYQDDGWFDVAALLEALISHLTKHGVEWRRQEVNSLKPDPRDGMVVVQTAKGELAYSQVVVASGAGISHLLKQSPLPDLPLIPAAGRILQGRLKRPMPDLVLKKGPYSLAINKGFLRLGSTSHRTVTPEDGEEALDLQFFLRVLRQEFRWDISAEDIEALELPWGVRIRTQDRNPFLGFLPFTDNSAPVKSGIYVLGGLYKSGLQLSDICAQLLLAQMTSEPPPEDYSFLIPRFDVKRLFPRS